MAKLTKDPEIIPALDIVTAFEDQAADHFKSGIRLLSVKGKISPDTEAELAIKYPAISIAVSDAETTDFYLSNGAVIKI